jgi:hypothetical protein
MGDTAALGNATAGVSWANTGGMFGVNIANFVVGTNNTAPLIFSINGQVKGKYTTAGLDVGNIIQDPVTAPSLLNDWVNFNEITSATVGYYKSRDGRVYLTGTIKNGTTTPGTDLFVMNAGNFPPKQVIFVVSNSGAFGEVQITNDGHVKIYGGGNTYLSLDGISFRTD